MHQLLLKFVQFVELKRLEDLKGGLAMTTKKIKKLKEKVIRSELHQRKVFAQLRKELVPGMVLVVQDSASHEVDEFGQDHSQKFEQACVHGTQKGESKRRHLRGHDLVFV